MARGEAHRARNGGPAAARSGTRRLCLLVALAVLLGGCLFPPVEPDGGEEDDPQPPDDPGGLVRREDSWEQIGQMERSASAGGFPIGQEVHEFRLPPRIQEMTLRLDWEAAMDEDLDLRVELRDDGRVRWGHSIAEGQTGEPDSPIVATFTDVPEIDSENETLLIATVTAKLTYDTPYVVSVRVSYLEAST